MIHTPWQHATADTTYDPARILCYDSEFVRERSYIPKLALVQTCQPGGVAQLYDPLNGDIPWATILRHPAPIVMHAAAQDLELMQLCGGALPASIRDTQTGFALCTPNLAISYAALVEHYLGIAPDKSQTRSDWLARPLQAAQLDYAADDVGLLARLHPLLVADLQRLDRLAWWAEESAAQLARQQQARDAWHWYRLQGAPQLRHDDKPVAQILVEARERLAAAHDLPRRAILSDWQIITIAQKRPHDPESLAEHLAPDHLLWQELPYLAQRFNDDTPPPAPPASPRLSPAKRQLYEQLCTYTADTAAVLNIHPDMLAPGRVLKHYIAKPDPASPLLTGWRTAFYRDHLTKLL